MARMSSFSVSYIDTIACTRLVLPVLASLLLAGCSFTTIGPDYKKPDTPLLRQAASSSLMTEALPSTLLSDEALPHDWWHMYQSSELDRLIREALRHNLDLRTALYNLMQSQAANKEVESQQQPQFDINMQPYYGHPSGLSELQPDYVPPNTWHYNSGLQISYQVDLFGQIKRAIESSQAESEAAKAAYDLVKVNVVAETARAWTDVCAAGVQIHTVQQSINLQRQSARLTEQLVQAGRAGELDNIRANAQVASLEASLPPLLAEQENGYYRLATLTGDLPENLPPRIRKCATLPTLKKPLPMGDMRELLGRRPDIRQRERLLAASTAKIGVAMADLYPKITLGFGASSAGLMQGIGEQDSRAWNLGPLISWTVPNTGEVQARIEATRAGAGADYARFEKTVLNALQEVRTALNNYVQELQRQNSLKQEVAARQNAAEQTRRLYTYGKVGYLDVLDAERTLADSQLALVQSAGKLNSDQIALFLALGGGW
ncbi:efflux transporter outer membrane subunit [Rahnella contaminans]|uniref:efflux transporter outer membrane subunit n=1 Tax=Rahnella contaminans TaxID=2703882 RepID=UPI0023DA423B|nr:TolC family protein [Rahnella contaminans]MDF1897200.1 TolC family protein [Rahnella contaminans]